MNQKPLSTRICLLLVLFFGIVAYSNTFNVPFHFDDQYRIAENLSLRPPLNLEKIWRQFPTRFVANLSFAFQYAFTGLAPWSFHCINLLIHLLASMAVFGIARLLLRTPALRGTLEPSQENLFALAPALLFLTHPVQTQAVTYIIQRMTSLAALFYLAALWMYLKARLEDARHYRLVFLFMFAALFTKEFSCTLPFAVLLTDFCFFPVSAEETVFKKIRRWLPFVVCLLVIPLTYALSSEQLARNMPTADAKTHRWDYLLTQFRVIRTYLRLVFFPANQCLDYDYRLSSGWGYPGTAWAFSLLLGIFTSAVVLFKKHRILSFGILWFFLTLSPESSFFPIVDVIFEHRLYLPMFGVSLFLASLLWLLAKSDRRFLAALLILSSVLSVMTYARNEVWKDPITLWRDTVIKSPLKGRPYFLLGKAYSETRKDEKTALLYYHKALQNGYSTTNVLLNVAAAYFQLGDLEKAAFYQNQAFSSVGTEDPQTQNILYLNQAALLRRENKIPEAINTLREAIQSNPQNHFFYVRLGELYRETGQEESAIACFRRAIAVAPLSKEGYESLALLYKEKGEKQKALVVLVEYLKLKKQRGPLLGN